jgi:2,4-dienoyl-CoA reductase-like NADH-dependent reductase (Old Yellow Enzyme family)/thioredoxin reductase
MEEEKMGQFDHILAPGTIGNCTIPNRLVVAPMVVNLNPVGGLASDAYIRYHEEKAKGGWGLIITEDYCVNEHAGGFAGIGGLYNEAQVESHKRFTDIIHKYGTKIFAQIYHAGRQSNHFVNGGVSPVSCSPIPDPFNKEIPHELTVPEIGQIVEDFAKTAANAKRAGFDGIEVHGAHGYLIHQFLSAASNKRIDEYGGNYENRVRFLKEILAAVRAAVGSDFVVQVRVSVDEMIDGGRKPTESHQIFRDIEASGADSIHTSFGMYGARSSLAASGSYFQALGFGAQFAKEVRKIVTIPVVASGNLHDPYFAEELLADGEADFITMGRQTLSDPHFPEKLKAGQLDEIRPCIRCLQGCLGQINTPGGTIKCLVNPELGHETEFDYTQAPVKKKVFVAGGGIAGMEAARAAKMKGHSVTLFEQSGTLGGQFLVAAYPPYKGGFASYPAWLNRQLQKLGVEIRLNTELMPEIVKAESPDKVIIATGGRPANREVKGEGTLTVLQAEDVLAGRSNAGMNVLVIGGGMIGSETASFLSTQCKASVAVSTRQADVCTSGISGLTHDDMKAELVHNFVKIYTETRLKEVTPEGAILENQKGEVFLHPCDTIVTAFGTVPYNPIEASLIGLCETVVVGDAIDARTGFEASQEGFKAGLFA